ncbi:PERI protein, partial [Syrrhaptes paradoxus]|nr:PERI protein [Syrrhaptes paradoxus]
RLEDETQKREDAEKSLLLFRKDMDDATLSRLELERRVELLLDEIGFLKKLHEEELRDMEVTTPVPAVSVEPEARTPGLTAALREIRVQYESIAVKNLQEAEEWYKSKVPPAVGGLWGSGHPQRSDSPHPRRDRLWRPPPWPHTSPSCSWQNEALQRQMREMEEAFGEEVGMYREAVGRLEGEIERLRGEMGRHLRQYQDLLHVKTALDVEIATYRKLLEGEESR